MNTILREQLLEAQNRMKQFTNAKRIEQVFAEQDLVLLKLRSYQQSSIAVRRYLKLAPKCYGPFKVEKKIGSIAYPLKLPKDAQIHPLFHVSMLKKYEGNILRATL